MPRDTTGSPPVRLTLLAGLGAIVALALCVFAVSDAAAASHPKTKHGRSARGHARKAGRDSSAGLGQLTGLLPSKKLTVESALKVDLDKESVRLPLYPGKAPDGTRVWYVLLDASDSGLAHDLGVN